MFTIEVVHGHLAKERYVYTLKLFQNYLRLLVVSGIMPFFPMEHLVGYSTIHKVSTLLKGIVFTVVHC